MINSLTSAKKKKKKGKKEEASLLVFVLLAVRYSFSSIYTSIMIELFSNYSKDISST
jgi:hypothetical protein